MWRVDIRYLDAATRQRSTELLDKIQKRRAVLNERARSNAVNFSGVDSDPQLLALRSELQAHQEDIVNLPTLDLDALRKAQHEDEQSACFRFEVILEVDSERVPLLTKVQALTLYELIGGMAGLFQDAELPEGDASGDITPDASDDW